MLALLCVNWYFDLRVCISLFGSDQVSNCLSSQNMNIAFHEGYICYRDKSISFRQYLCMFGGVCLGLFPDVFIYALIAYPIDDCRNLSVDPEAMTVLESPAETQLALCIKHVNLKLFHKGCLHKDNK